MVMANVAWVLVPLFNVGAVYCSGGGVIV